MTGKLRRLKDSAHEGVRYSCDQCDVTVRLLRKHKSSVHERYRCECNTCDYKAARNEDMKRFTIFNLMKSILNRIPQNFNRFVKSVISTNPFH